MNDIRSSIQKALPTAEDSPTPSETPQNDSKQKSEYLEAIEKLCNKHRITPRTELPPMKFLFTFNGTPCFPTCELVAETGKAKSGKTLFMSLLMSCALNGEQLALKRVDDAPLTVLWFDTEQSEQSTQDILLHRIMPLAGIEVKEAEGYIDSEGREVSFDDLFYVLNVRGIGWEKRKEVLKFAIKHYQPSLVILDGIKDLLLDINDATQASITTEELMSCAQTNKCCIVNVLHQNKSEADRNMRGSIGTELTNKAFEAFECEVTGSKDDEDDQEEVFTVKHAMSRKKRSSRRLYYRLNDQDLPETCSKPEEQGKKQGDRRSQGSAPATAMPKAAGTVAMAPELKWEAFNPVYLIHDESVPGRSWKWDLAKLFADAFEHREQRKYSQVMAAVMRLSHIKDKGYYYNRYQEAMLQGIISEARHPDTGDTWVVLKTEALPF